MLAAVIMPVTLTVLLSAETVWWRMASLVTTVTTSTLVTVAELIAYATMNAVTVPFRNSMKPAMMDLSTHVGPATRLALEREPARPVEMESIVKNLRYVTMGSRMLVEAVIKIVLR